MNITDSIKIKTMKTIEERAREFVEKAAAGQDVPDYINELLISCYCAAAEEERALLTQWHDAKTDRPPIGKTVLLKLAGSDEYIIPYGYIYCVGDRYKADRYVLPAHCAFRDVIAWRELHI